MIAILLMAFKQIFKWPIRWHDNRRRLLEGGRTSIKRKSVWIVRTKASFPHFTSSYTRKKSLKQENFSRSIFTSTDTQLFFLSSGEVFSLFFGRRFFESTFQTFPSFNNSKRMKNYFFPNEKCFRKSNSSAGMEKKSITEIYRITFWYS